MATRQAVGEMHDLLFENQKALQRADLEGYAEQLGLKMGKFKAALDKGTYKAQIAEDMALGEKVQSQGTPNHFVNGRKLKGAKPFEEFKTVIDEELGDSLRKVKDREGNAIKPLMKN